MGCKESNQNTKKKVKKHEIFIAIDLPQPLPFLLNSHQSLPFMYTQSMDVDEDSEQNLDFSGWLVCMGV